MTRKASPPPAAKDFEWLPWASLRPWDKNPRHNDSAVDPVARSIARWGFIRPITVWRSRERMVAGHTALKAFAAILSRGYIGADGQRVPAQPMFCARGAPGPGLVPVRFHEFESEAEADAYAIADNKLAEIASWDEAGLAQLLREQQEVDALLPKLAGFNERELAQLLGAPDEDKGATAPQAGAGVDLDALRAKWNTAAGQLWEIESRASPGRAHRVLCGDCRDVAAVRRLAGAAGAALAFTSPPYASQRKYDEASEFRPIRPDSYVEWFEAVQSAVRAVLAPTGSWFVNIKEHCEEGQRHLYVLDLVIAHVRRWGWLYVDEFCWRDTKNGVPGAWSNRFKDAWEPVFHFSLGRQITFNPDAVAIESADCFRYDKRTRKSSNGSGFKSGEPAGGLHEGLARCSNVLEIPAAAGGDGHPAAFPVELPEFFLRAFSNPCDVVFDPFLGSGSTLRAAERTGRLGIGCEISPKYLAITLESASASGLACHLRE